jgi:hypothetical protein
MYKSLRDRRIQKIFSFIFALIPVFARAEMASSALEVGCVWHWGDKDADIFKAAM